MDWGILDNKYLIAIASSVSGIALTLITQQILNKRGLFTYFVHHGRVGVSADDAIFGSVRVTWNGNPVANLYSSTIELVNHSMKDYENVVVRAFSNDTILLSERTEVVGTTRILSWSPEFSQRLAVPAGQVPTEAQRDLYSRQREFLVPVLNRGQIIRLHFLNAAKTPNQPTLWLDVLHKGVKARFRVPQPEFMGVPQPLAALVGVILGFAFLAWVIVTVQSLWLAALLALVYGFIAQLPGALLIRAWRRVKEWLGG